MSFIWDKERHLEHTTGCTEHGNGASLAEGLSHSDCDTVSVMESESLLMVSDVVFLGCSRSRLLGEECVPLPFPDSPGPRALPTYRLGLYKAHQDAGPWEWDSPRCACPVLGTGVWLVSVGGFRNIWGSFLGMG